MSERLPRFKRHSTVAPMELTERDREIIRFIHRHRFLRSPQIVALAGGSPQHVLRRLKSLYHHCYLERPRSQIDYYHKGGTRHMVYGLGNKAATVLKQDFDFGEKNRGAGRIFLEHALLVSDVMVAIELACRKNGKTRLVYGADLSLPSDVRWKLNINGLKLTAVPDRVFALEFKDGNGSDAQAYFFLEADRGTMPVTRKNLRQTSFHRKLLAYEATWAQDIHRSRFGFNRFRVLTVTTSASRVKSLVDACTKLKSGHGLFLFTDKTILEKPFEIFSHTWQTGRPNETTHLLD